MTLAAWVHDPGLAPVWTAARNRLERNGIDPRGVLTVGGLDRSARHAVSGLLGRPVVRDSCRVDLEALDAAARERSGAAGLVDLLERLGGPLRNRPAERSSTAADREAPFSAAREWLASHPRVASQTWVEPWLSGVRRSRLPSAAEPEVAARRLLTALRIAEQLLGAEPPPPVARNELAARVTGDAHALDDGTVLSQLVLRALAAAAGEEPPGSAAGRRALWERHAVSADAVSSTCLVLGLRPTGQSVLARRLCSAADAGDPTHVTGWDLGRGDVAVAARTVVLVCENPRVLQAVAEHRGGSVAVVCTSGMPGLVAVEVLRRLARGGAGLAYHGDFDWPGVAIANRMVAALGCAPWRMGVADYLQAARDDGLPLEGPPVAAVWDRDLSPAMERIGTAVHEEAVLDTLLDALPP